MYFEKPYIQMNGCTINNHEAQQSYQAPPNQLPAPRQQETIVVCHPMTFWGGILAIACLAVLVGTSGGTHIYNNVAPPQTTVNNNFTSK